MSTSGPGVARAVRDALAAAAAGDEDRRWELVSHLQRHGGRAALRIATRLAGHPEPVHRTLASDILAQLGAGPGRAAVDGPYRDECLARLLGMSEREEDPAVLHSVAIGFGHIGDARCVGPLARMRAHPDARVRYGAAFGLLGRPEDAALDALIALSVDSEAHVRDWATFGLGRQTTRDFPRLREALAARLDDDDPETRAEAIHGLAVRGDERATGPLLDALRPDSPLCDDYIIAQGLHALAAATADPRLYAHLRADRDRWLADSPDDDLPDEDLPESLRAALARYEPTGDG